MKSDKISPMLLILALAWLLGGRLLPLEASVTSSVGPLVFIIKSTLTFISLLPMLLGWGLFLLLLLGRIAVPTGISEENYVTQPRLALWTGCALLLGVATTGLFIFVSGLVWAPSWKGALPLVSSGYLLFALAWSRRWLNWRPCVTHVFQRDSKKSRSWDKRLLWLLGMAVFVRTSGVYFFQGHEDAYLYHLSAAESWLQRGQTGVFLTNIFSGYALAVEHYYLFLKLLARGNAEQNALAQLSHAIFGYGTFVCALLVLAEPWLKRRERAAFILVCMHTWLIFFMLLPKNDGYLAASVGLALVGLVRGMPIMFFAGAATAMIMKPTSGVTFVALGIATIICNLFKVQNRWREVAQSLRLLFAGAVLMILSWAPFGWRNAVVTGDPFFPLLTEIFPTPFAPSLSRVITEAAPFQLNFDSLLRSFGRLLSSDAMIVIATATLLGSLFSRKGRQALSTIAKDPGNQLMLAFLIIGFVLLQLFTGEFGHHLESRHYLVVLGPLLVLSAIVFVAPFSDRHRTWITPTVIALIGLGYSNFDVAARDLYRGITSSNITSTFLARKPNFMLNDYLAQKIKAAAPNHLPKVYANTICYAEYFLNNAEFWHPNKTHPAWTWNVQSISGPEVLNKLYEHHIDYVITDDTSSLATALRQRAAARILQRAGNVELWQLEPSST